MQCLQSVNARMREVRSTINVRFVYFETKIVFAFSLRTTTNRNIYIVNWYILVLVRLDCQLLSALLHRLSLTYLIFQLLMLVLVLHQLSVALLEKEALERLFPLLRDILLLDHVVQKMWGAKHPFGPSVPERLTTAWSDEGPRVTQPMWNVALIGIDNVSDHISASECVLEFCYLGQITIRRKILHLQYSSALV